jgi:hypothetical protein
VYKRTHKVDYTTFDDIKPFLDPELLDEKVRAKFKPKMKMMFGEKMGIEDVLRKLEPWETNMRCLTSLKWHVAHKTPQQIAEEKRPSLFSKARERHEPYASMRNQTEVERETRKQLQK